MLTEYWLVWRFPRTVLACLALAAGLEAVACHPRLAALAPASLQGVSQSHSAMRYHLPDMT